MNQKELIADGWEEVSDYGETGKIFAKGRERKLYDTDENKVVLTYEE